MSWQLPAVAQSVDAFGRRLLERWPRVADELDLVANGEWGIALENLISNLHEDEVWLSPDEVAEGERLVGDLGLDAMYVDVLRALPGPGQTGLRAEVFTVKYAAAAPALLQRLAAAALRAVPIKVWCWEVLAKQAPGPALDLLRGLLDASTATGASLTLVGCDGATIDPARELDRLAASTAVGMARVAQDRRVRFAASAEAPPGLRDVVTAAVRARVGWPTLAISQDEAIVVDEVVVTPDGWRLRVVYTLDHDFCSQYDRTETVTGACTVDAGGAVVDVRWDPAAEPADAQNEQAGNASAGRANR